MQVRVLEGSPDVFNMLIYPDQNPFNQQFLQDQLTNFQSSLTEAGKQFMTGARDVYDRIHNSEAMQMAKAVIRQVGAFFNPDTIIPLDSILSIQQASLTMQRWVMAEPTIRSLYHKQLVNGYSDTYVDMEPDRIGEEHYDYRRVMHGVVRDDVEDYDWVVTMYPDDLHEGDRELTALEQNDVCNMWDLVKLYAQARQEDPTDPYAGNIG